jgi:MerR family copper efflux transcriptional regulator
MRPITIGALSKAAGVGVETVRFYERKGLLRAPHRRTSGYRLYDQDAIERLRFIRRAKSIGFTLNEILELLTLCDDPSARRMDVRAQATRKIAEIDVKVSDLLAMRQSLDRLLNSCEGDGPASGCPIITALKDTELKEENS